MVKTRIPFRFVFDSYFFNDLGAKGGTTLSSVLVNLMYINNDSKLYKRAHNIISKKSFDAIDRNFAGDFILRAALKPVEEPAQIESIADEITRTLKYAILYKATIPKPNEVYLFTTDALSHKYTENETASELGDFTIITENNAIKEIKYWFEEIKEMEHDGS